MELSSVVRLPKNVTVEALSVDPGVGESITAAFWACRRLLPIAMQKMGIAIEGNHPNLAVVFRRESLVLSNNWRDALHEFSRAKSILSS